MMANDKPEKPEDEITDNMVYVRKVFVEDLSEQLQEQAEGLQVLYAVHDASGTRLALVANKNHAFSLARQNDFLPQSVH